LESGLKETIQAMQLIQSQFSDADFFLIGNGSAVDYLKNLVKTAGLQQNVVIHGPVAYEEIPMYIAMADVGIVPLPDHPYWRFQSPLKLLEYLAMGKTVILTDIPAHRSVVCEEKCVIYISSINPDEIAKAIAYAYNHKKNLTDWGKCGPAIVEEKYTWDQLAETLDNYLLSRDAVSRP
jgi:glycosyltransferase involved in cell wall biosynthesis